MVRTEFLLVPFRIIDWALFTFFIPQRSSNRIPDVNRRSIDQKVNGQDRKLVLHIDAIRPDRQKLCFLLFL